MVDRTVARVEFTFRTLARSTATSQEGSSYHLWHGRVDGVRLFLADDSFLEARDGYASLAHTSDISGGYLEIWLNIPAFGLGVIDTPDSNYNERWQFHFDVLRPNPLNRIETVTFTDIGVGGADFIRGGYTQQLTARTYAFDLYHFYSTHRGEVANTHWTNNARQTHLSLIHI